jgi:hypothetical protein
MNSQKIKFELSVEQTNIILVALSKQQYDVVSPVIEELKTQAAPQLQAQPEVSVAE